MRFEQLDVANIVLKHIPLGTNKATISASFASLDAAKIVEDSPGTLVVRANRGRAMLDPDARSVVIGLSVHPNEKLTKVDAHHLKNQ